MNEAICLFFDVERQSLFCPKKHTGVLEYPKTPPVDILV